jgi:hypothetical protein
MSWQSQQVLYCIQVILAVLVLPFSIREVAWDFSLSCFLFKKVNFPIFVFR